MCCFFSSVGIQHLTVSSSLYIFTPLMENFRDTGRLLLHVWGKMSIECVTVFQSAGHSCCHSNRKVLFCSVLSYHQEFQLSVELLYLVIQTLVVHGKRSYVLYTQYTDMRLIHETQHTQWNMAGTDTPK